MSMAAVTAFLSVNEEVCPMDEKSRMRSGNRIQQRTITGHLADYRAVLQYLEAVAVIAMACFIDLL